MRLFRREQQVVEEPEQQESAQERVHRKFLEESEALMGKVSRHPSVTAVGFDYLPKGERVFLENDGHLNVKWIAPGGNIEASTPKEKKFEVARDQVGFHIYEFSDKLEADIGSVDKVCTKAVDSMVYELIRRFVVLVQSSVDNTQYSDGRSALNSPVQLSDATLAQVAQQTDRPGRLLVVGSLASVVEINPYDYGSSYFSVDVLPLSGRLAEGLPHDKAWVVNTDTYEAVVWGNGKAKVYEEQDNWFTHWQHREEVGIAFTESTMEVFTR